MEDKQLPIRIREATEPDISFIFNAWLKSFRDSSLTRNVTSTIYFSEHHKVIENLLKNQKMSNSLQCRRSEPNLRFYISR